MRTFRRFVEETKLDPAVDPQATASYHGSADQTPTSNKPQYFATDRDAVAQFMQDYRGMSPEQQREIPLATIINMLWKAQRYGLIKLPG